MDEALSKILCFFLSFLVLIGFVLCVLFADEIWHKIRLVFKIKEPTDPALLNFQMLEQANSPIATPISNNTDIPTKKYRSIDDEWKEKKMNLRELIKSVMDTEKDIDQKVSIRIHKRNKKGDIIATKIVPIERYFGSGQLLIEESELKATEWDEGYSPGYVRKSERPNQTEDNLRF